jgi:hypothetical protein
MFCWASSQDGDTKSTWLVGWFLLTRVALPLLARPTAHRLLVWREKKEEADEEKGTKKQLMYGEVRNLVAIAPSHVLHPHKP